MNLHKINDRFQLLINKNEGVSHWGLDFIYKEFSKQITDIISEDELWDLQEHLISIVDIRSYLMGQDLKKCGLDSEQCFFDTQNRKIIKLIDPIEDDSMGVEVYNSDHPILNDKSLTNKQIVNFIRLGEYDIKNIINGAHYIKKESQSDI